ncbi:MAG: acyl carrier protein [Puniceicoccales bacterium]|jgi:acyl carrier protein|nr:acyl carrier protein [Puniceicoccales bacterium]
MNKEEILSEIKGHLHKLFEIDPDTIKPESHLYADLGLDSIDAVDLVVQIQRATGRKIKPQDFKSVRTVGDVVDAVKALLEQPETPDNAPDGVAKDLPPQ